MRRPPVVLLRRLALLHPLQLLLALQVFHTFCHPRRRRRALQVMPEPLHDSPVVARVGWVKATAETHHNPDVMMGSTPFHPHSPMSYVQPGGKYHRPHRPTFFYTALSRRTNPLHMPMLSSRPNAVRQAGQWLSSMRRSSPLPDPAAQRLPPATSWTSRDVAFKYSIPGKSDKMLRYCREVLL